jgi:hypothetical protein
VQLVIEWMVNVSITYAPNLWIVLTTQVSYKDVCFQKYSDVFRLQSIISENTIFFVSKEYVCFKQHALRVNDSKYFACLVLHDGSLVKKA